MKITDTHIYFLASNEPFSNWYPTKFQEDNLSFHSTEQYMMYHKAKLFNDHETADKIMNKKCNFEPVDLNNSEDKAQWKILMSEIKQLGREVKNFDPVAWNEQCIDIVSKGIFLKFTQNEELKEFLLNSQGKKLIEAADYDKVWGVGLKETDPLILDEKNWKGTNYLGVCLMKVRDEISLNHKQNVKFKP